MSVYLNSLLVGILVGILINYFSDSLPHRRRPTPPLCNHCGHRVTLFDYLTLRQCIYCGNRRRFRWLVVYAVSIGVVTWTQIFPVRLGFWLSLIVFILFGVISVIDIEYRAVLIESVIVGGVIFLAIGIYRHGIISTLIGGAFGFFVMFLLYWFGKVVLGLRNKASFDEEALGFGDVNLFAIIGFLLGWPAILLALWIAIFSAGAVSLIIMIYLLLRKRYRSNIAIPYAPFLIFGAFTLLYLTKAG